MMAEKRILLLEDDDIVATMLETALSTVGYTVDVATTVAVGDALVAAQSYALVIADWRLPDGNGWTVADCAAALGAKTFLMSGYAQDMSPQVRRGHECVVKPIRIGPLPSYVSDAIGGP
jgi:DNA-binding response OmpR family regulator